MILTFFDYDCRKFLYGHYEYVLFYLTNGTHMKSDTHMDIHVYTYSYTPIIFMFYLMAMYTLFLYCIIFASLCFVDFSLSE